MTKITVASADDWIGVYADGELIHEGHSVDLTYFISYIMPLAGINLGWEVKNADEDWLVEDVGNFPTDLAEVKWAK